MESSQRSWRIGASLVGKGLTTTAATLMAMAFDSFLWWRCMHNKHTQLHSTNTSASTTATFVHITTQTYMSMYELMPHDVKQVKPRLQ